MHAFSHNSINHGDKFITLTEPLFLGLYEKRSVLHNLAKSIVRQVARSNVELDRMATRQAHGYKLEKINALLKSTKSECQRLLLN